MLVAALLPLPWWLAGDDPAPHAPAPSVAAAVDSDAPRAATAATADELAAAPCTPECGRSNQPSSFLTAAAAGAPRRGLVLDERGQPVPGARVRGTTTRAIAVTDEQGAFAWSGAAGMLTADAEQRTCVLLADLARSAPPVLLLVPKASTRVQVVDPCGVPIAGASLSLAARWDPLALGVAHAAMGSLPPERSFLSDSAGSIDLEHAAGMPYGITVTGAGFAPAAAWLIGNAALTITLVPARMLVGTVADARGSPVAGARVEVMAAAGASTVSDSTGSFVLVDVPAHGDIGLLCRHAEYAPRALAVGPVATGPVRFFLTPSWPMVGRVLDGNGCGSRGALVHVVGPATASEDPLWTSPWPEWRGTLIARADETGAFAIPGLPPGEYEVRAFDPDDPGRSECCVAAVPGSTATIRLAAGERSMVVQLHVRTELDSAPLADCRLQIVELDGAGAATYSQERGDADGWYRVAAARREGQYLCVGAPGCADKIVPLSATSDRDAIEVWLQPARSWTVRLADATTGAGLSGTVSCRDAARRPVRLRVPTEVAVATTVPAHGSCELVDGPSGTLSFSLVAADGVRWMGTTHLPGPLGSVVWLSPAR